MTQKGQLNWVFAGGEIWHEAQDSLTVTNLNERPAHLTFDVYFSDRDPIKGLTLTLEAERVTSFKLNEPFCDQNYKIPLGIYALVLHSDQPVVAIFGRSTQGYFY